MRYLGIILLLLSACTSIPEDQTGTYYPGTFYTGPSYYWGFSRGVLPLGSTQCFRSGFQIGIGQPLFPHCNCATPLFFTRAPIFLPSNTLSPNISPLRMPIASAAVVTSQLQRISIPVKSAVTVKRASSGGGKKGR